MKISYTKILLFIVILFSTAFAGAYIYDVQGRSESGDVKIQWRTQEESNMDHFAIERRSGTADFVEVAKVDSKGDNSFYEFVDRSAYKTNDIVFYYRIAIVETNGKISHSNEITVAPLVSGYKRTWGSIKALFR